MKKLFIVAFAALATLAACNKDNAGAPVSGDTAEVTLTVDLPVGLQTKAIGDGLTATELSYAVYTADKTQYLASISNATPVMVGAKAWSLTLTLVRNYTYHIFFWAQAPVAEGQTSPYTFDKANGEVRVSYEGAANDEKRDAFCALYTITVPADARTFAPQDPVVLTRPFAQINLCSSDYGYVSELGLDMTSKVTLTGVADKYDFLNGTVEGDVAVDFDLAPVPVGDGETIVIVDANGTSREYANVGMNYILAPENTVFNEDGTPVNDPTGITDLTAQFAYNSKTVDIEVPNVPYQRNFRTNIIGNFFTGEATIEIKIDEAFYRPDHITNYPATNN